MNIISIEYITLLQQQREEVQVVDEVCWQIKQLKLEDSAIELAEKFNRIRDEYTVNVKMITDLVESFIPTRVIDLFKQTNHYSWFYFPSVILMKDNKIHLTLGNGWDNIKFKLDIITNELTVDNFATGLHDLSDYKDELESLLNCKLRVAMK